MKNSSIRKLLPFIVLAFGVLYGLWPADLIPDVPIIGWVDDIGVLGTAILIAIKIYSKNKEANTKENS